VTIDFSPEVKVRAFWYGSWESGDWLAAVTKRPGEGWQVDYRTRLYSLESGDDPFGDEDEKIWRSFGGQDADETELTADMIAALLSVNNGCEVHKYLIDGSGSDAMKVLEELPWFHCRRTQLCPVSTEGLKGVQGE